VVSCPTACPTARQYVADIYSHLGHFCGLVDVELLALERLRVTKLSILAVASVSLLPANYADGQTIDGNTLYSACMASEDLIQQGFCIGWMIGQIEGESSGAFIVLSQAGDDNTAAEVNPVINLFLGRCIPESATNQQLKDVVVRYLENHPETRHQPARLLANLALGEAFPCPIE